MELQLPDYIRTIRPYIPGKPIEETKREYHLKRVVKLASNENPLGPSPKAVEAIRKALKELHRYPDSSGHDLKQGLSRSLGFPVSQIALGNGSNELIDLLICAFCIPGDAIVTSKAAFVAYKVCAQVHGVRTLEAEIDEKLEVDLDSMLDLVQRDSRVKLVFLANPNNPTGTYVKDKSLRSFLAEVAKVRGGSVLVALDYAYWEYVTAPDLSDPAKLVREFPNTVMLRTFSKVYGLAGNRVGYWVAPPELTSAVDKVREPFNLNSLGLAAAEAALLDRAFVSKAKRANAQGMAYWKKFLKKMSVPFWESQGNFLLIDAKTGFGRSGGELFEACLAEGVIFRPVTNYGLPDCLRISIGTQAENVFASRALEKTEKKWRAK